MKSKFKGATLESMFPLLAVENNCIVSKGADITAAFRLVLPEIFTVTSSEYETLHAVWVKALRVLPDFSIVHKQDFFLERRYRPKVTDEQSFLARAYERHFNERPYLDHACYLYVTKTTRERTRARSNFSTLCRGGLVPCEIRDRDILTQFMDAVSQMERILRDSGLIGIERLTAEEIIGTDNCPGLLDRYFSLDGEQRVNEDIRIDPGRMTIGDKILCVHTLSDLDDLPQGVATDTRYEKLSTDQSDCRLCFAAPVGLLLSCSHIYNQFIFIDSHAETLKRFEQSARNMNSLSRYSRVNALNKEWIDLYLDQAHTNGFKSVRCHCNVVAWAEDDAQFKRIRNEVGSALALMNCTPRHNTVDVPALH